MTDQQYRHFERKDFYNSHHSVIAKHQDAMTGESLNGKADIAMELAFRDIRIAELEVALKEYYDAHNSLYTISVGMRPDQVRIEPHPLLTKDSQ